MDFFDDDDPPDEPPRGEPREPIRGSGGDPAGGGGGHIRPPANRQQARARQAGLAVGAIIFLILIVIAFRGCLDARKDRSYQNYVSDLSSITSETEQLSNNFFERFKGGTEGSSGDIGFDTEVEGDKGTSQGLLDRAQGLDAPGDISGAQEQIVLSFELRHDALEGIAAQLKNLSAGGKQADKAGDAIYTQMKVFSASDILYARAQDQIEQALIDQDVVVDNGVPDSQFLPTIPTISTRRSPPMRSAASRPTAAAPATQPARTTGSATASGWSTASPCCMPSGTALTNGGTFTAAEGDDTIEVAVQNQGEADESNIDVTVSSATAASTPAGRSTRSPPARPRPSTSSSIPLPKAGDSVTLDVDVATVGCEQVADNNKATYTIGF